MNSKILILCLVLLVLLYIYICNSNKELFTNSKLQPIKKLAETKSSCFKPYLEKIRKIETPKLEYYEKKLDTNSLVFNNSKNQSRRNQELNRLNKKYFTVDDDAINQLLLPKNNELFMI